MDLFHLGWNPSFAHHFEQLHAPELTPARIARQDRQRYLVWSTAGVQTCLLPGRLLFDGEDRLPAVGDWTAVLPLDDGQALLHAVLPRMSAFSRKEAGTVTREQVIAANIDLAFLVTGLDHDFNIRRLERYAVQVSASGARPIVVLNKSDLCPDVDMRVSEVRASLPGVEVLVLSAQLGLGLEALRSRIESGKTAVFLGSSGVGKSTVINRLAGFERQATRAVREDDSRGRHATTHRELILLPEGGVVIDTPGLRELQLWSGEDDLQGAFTDIEALAAGCRYRDCTHMAEPGCAVREAIEEGRLDPGRWQSYLKLRREIAYLEERREQAAPYAVRRREKQFGKMLKHINRHNPKR